MRLKHILSIDSVISIIISSLLIIFLIITNLIRFSSFSPIIIVLIILWFLLLLFSNVKKNNESLLLISHLGHICFMSASFALLLSSILVIKTSFNFLLILQSSISICVLIYHLIISIKKIKTIDLDEKTHKTFVLLNAGLIIASLLLIYFMCFIPSSNDSLTNTTSIYNVSISFVFFLILGFWMIPFLLWLHLIIFEIVIHKTKRINILKNSHINYIILPLLSVGIMYIILNSFAINNDFTLLFGGNSNNYKLLFIFTGLGYPKITSVSSFDSLIASHFYFSIIIVGSIIFLLIVLHLFFGIKTGIYVLSLSISSLISFMTFGSNNYIIDIILILVILFYLNGEFWTIKNIDKTSLKKYLFVSLILFVICSFAMIIPLSSLILSFDSGAYDTYSDEWKLMYDTLNRGYDNIKPSIYHVMVYSSSILLLYHIILYLCFNFKKVENN